MQRFVPVLQQHVAKAGARVGGRPAEPARAAFVGMCSAPQQETRPVLRSAAFPLDSPARGQVEHLPLPP